MKKCISCIRALLMVFVYTLSLFVPVVMAADEPIQIPLSYYDSTTCVVSDSGGTYDNSYPLDGDFTTFYKSQMVTGGYYTVALDGTYELSSMKIYQGYARSDYSRMNKVYISEDGKTFTEVTNVSISATSWMTNEETNFTTLARIDYVFSAGTKAKFVKITNDLAGSTQVAMAEIRIYGVKQKEPVTPELMALTVSSGELSPAFNKTVTDYSVSVNSLKNALPEISATAAEDCTITVTQPCQENGYVGTVLVYETANAENKKTYTITVTEVKEPVSIPLSYYDSTPCKVSDSAGSYDKLYPLDGDFSTDFKSTSVVGGYYTVALDGEYEL
ncbi:MAG: discoidin domain-containing protein, partial [Clostridia bacterium]